MDSRPDKGPGSFKQQGNQAGSTLFVAPDLVEGTLEQGFALYRSLEGPFARAVFMMFLDLRGASLRRRQRPRRACHDERRADRGRGGAHRHPDRLPQQLSAALKALTQTGTPDPLIRTLDYAQRWTAAVEWGELNATRRELEGCNAFLDPGEAEEQGIRLRLPRTEVM